MEDHDTKDLGARGYVRHGMTYHEHYPIWAALRARCFSSAHHAYKDYGGRGISICKEWASSPVKFIKWLEASGYKKGLHLCRIDNNGDYSPENCRVATVSENGRNRRNNTVVNLFGSQRLIIDVSEEYSISAPTLRMRLNSGMTPEQAVKVKARTYVKKRVSIGGIEYNINQAAKRLGLKPWALYYQISKGDLPGNAILVGG